VKLRVQHEVDRKQWDERVLSLGGTVFHSAAWAEYTSAAYPGASPLFMTMISKDGQTTGVALGFQLRATSRLMRRFSGRLWLDATPVVADRTKLGEFLHFIEKHGRDSGDVELQIGSFASYGGAKALDEMGFQLTSRLEFELDLALSEEELWDALDYKRRKNVRKAERKGVSLRDLDGEEAVNELRRLQAASSRRIVDRGGHDIAYRDDPRLDPVHVLVRQPVTRVVAAEVEGEGVSAGLFTCFGGLVYHTLSGHSKKAFDTQAPTFLLWETIKRYRREGAQRFNFGGCSADAVREDSPEHGVYVYKNAFGAECLECASGLKVIRPHARRFVKILKAVFRH